MSDLNNNVKAIPVHTDEGKNGVDGNVQNDGNLPNGKETSSPHTAGSPSQTQGKNPDDTREGNSESLPGGKTSDGSSVNPTSGKGKLANPTKGKGLQGFSIPVKQGTSSQLHKGD